MCISRNSIVLSIALFWATFTQVVAQDYLGFANSPFAGVNGIDVNPAFIVNNPRKWDMTIAGVNLMAGNNYLGFQKRALDHTGSTFEGDYPAFEDEDFAQNYFSVRNPRHISTMVAANVTLPSFMFTRKKQKDAFAFSCRTRAYANVDGINPALVDIILSGDKDTTLFNQLHSVERISAQAMLWMEYGLSYGKTIKETNNERLNVAGRLKYLKGLYAMNIFIKNVDYSFHEADSVLILTSDISYGHSSNLEFNQDAIKNRKGGKPAFALDLGATYEFHPLTDVRSRVPSESKTSPFKQDYKYRLGFSIQDLGWIKYLKSGNARDFKMDVNQNMDFGEMQTSGDNPLGAFDDSLKAKYTIDESDDKFRMNLPTLLSIQGDYYYGHNLYLNSTINYAFQFLNNADKVHEATTFSLTPRWDWKWLGFYMPLSFNKYSHFRLGASARIGPLIVGMADVLPIIGKWDVYGVDFHFMLKVPHIHLKKKNKRTRSKFEVQKGAKAEKRPKQAKRIWPGINWFKKKNKHNANPQERDHIIYFEL